MLAAFLTTVAFALADTPLSAPAAEPLASAAAEAPEMEAQAAPAAFAALSDREIEGEVLRHLESLDTLSGSFVQTAPSGAVATGAFYLRRPGQLRFDYDDPSPITIVATGGLVYVENSELETTDSYPLKKTPLKFLVARKIEIPESALKSVERSADQIALTYVSAEEDAEGEITLVLSAPDLAIREWTVRDAQGGLTVVALKEVKAGEALDNRLFRAPEAGGAFINN